MRHSIEIRPYEQKMIQNPDNPDDPTAKIIEPLSKMTKSNKKQYFADIRVMNFILQGIPNDIYNSLAACKNAQQMWERIRRKTEYDHLFDTLSQYDPHVNASRANKVARNHDPLALVAHSNVYPLHSHASPLYSHSPQPYYVTHPSLVVDYEEDYQGEIQGDTQGDKLTTAMMLLVRAITQRYSTPTNNRLRTSSKTMNQAVIQDGRVDIQRKNIGYVGNGKPNVQCYNYNAKGHYAHDCPQPKVCDTKYFREQMLLAMKDEAGENLNEEENDFMLNNHYGDNSLEELNAALIMMEHIQLVENKVDAEPTYNADAFGEVNSSHIHLKSRMHSKSVHEHTNHVKLKTDINISDDDQIDSSIIFDDPYVENNGGADEHDSNAHDQSVTLKSLIQNVLKEAKNQPYEELKREIRVDKDKVDNLIKEKDKIQDEFFNSKMKLLEYDMKLSYPKRLLKKEKTNILKRLWILEKNSVLMIRLFTKWDNQFKQFICLGKNQTSTKLIIDSPDSEKTLKDAEESRLEMKDTIIQLNYEKLNALYETFVPQTEIAIDQTYLSTLSTSNVPSQLIKEMSDLHLLITISKLKAKLAAQAKNVNTMFDKYATLEKLVCVTPLSKNKDLKATTVSKVERKTAVKSSKLEATHVVAKVRFSVATPLKATNRVSSASPLTLESSGFSKHMTRNLKLLRNFIEKFMGTIRFGNDNFALITAYGDYVQGNLTICHIYYAEGIEHNLLSVRQFCDGDLEVAFHSNTCFVRN
ncbi:integrase, catalytic region, zinc finger, CCHC-type containing protein [Tanacetum coccineum]|uniref:Integrase, catalytic region, zinc finger, CCHC-type containing protein n=1 Tax=Tanacetum coccineum TaxID=301880 RepID=A0ABQ5IKQ3_9ASTR